MESEDEHQIQLLGATGNTGGNYEDDDRSEQNEYLRECLAKQSATINYLKELVVDAKLPFDATRVIDPSIPSDPFNGWTSDTEKLLATWKDKLTSTSFVYGVVLDKYRSRFNRIQILSAFFSALITLLGVILSTLGSNNIWVDRGIGIAVAIIGMMVTVLTSIIKINGWDAYTTNIAKLVQQIDNLCARVSTESYLPRGDRTMANEFVMEVQKQLNQVTQNRPHISSDDYEMAERLYEKEVAHQQSLLI